MSILFLILAIIFFVLWSKEKKTGKVKAEQDAALLSEANQRLEFLSKYQSIIDVEEECENRKSAADAEIASLKAAAQNNLDEATKIRTEAESNAKEIISAAEKEAKRIADSALNAKNKAEEYQATIVALKNVINGYGDEWLKPTYSLLDELAEEFSFDDAGKELTKARTHSIQMVKDKSAASCDYVQEARRITAINFVIDAFNGKVDSILSKTKKNNYGTLEQQIKDAFRLVNINGEAFRGAKITPKYLDARLDELKWAVICQELKAKQLEEQRQIRAQMREEEKARREFERAQKEAAKEETMLRKAMEKAQAAMERASEAQKAQFESQLADLQQKLVEAEEKNQRAISMAQQTKRGNVYVISNIGSFGENIYKVGMTRRLEPLDRVKELGDASVPFPFDVHAIIESDDAPALETSLHKALALMQVNKVNPRKEFFRVNLTDIRKLVDSMGLSAIWTMEAVATEYRETLTIEESMKNDPIAKRRWEEYYASLAEKPSDLENESDD